MQNVAIDSKVPIPDRIAGDRSKYPWIEMNIGDSFFVPGRKIESFSGQVVSASKRFGTKYTCRTEDNGVRVWRIK